MPRIEITPTNHRLDCGEPSPTIDVCSHCVTNCKEQERTDEILSRELQGIYETIGVEHPCYESDLYFCQFCDKRLTTKDE